MVWPESPARRGLTARSGPRFHRGRQCEQTTEAVSQWRELERRPANERHFEQLDRPEQRWPPMPDGRQRDPYLYADSHPDCVAHVWDFLGDTLPEDCRFLLLGRPVLAHPVSGFVFAMPHGTQYGLWIPEPEHTEATVAGLVPTMTWSGGGTTDLAAEFGEGWLFGKSRGEEVAWLAAAHVAAAVPPVPS